MGPDAPKDPLIPADPEEDDEYVDDEYDVAAEVEEALADIDAYRKLAGLEELKVKLTLPSREYVSGEGNKSGLPRSIGTGAGDMPEPKKGDDR